MYTKILKPEIMATMLPKDFPADKLSKPHYKMVVERDVFVTMRDGVRVACDIFRPDSAGEFPALYATCGYQKDLEYLPQWPVFHFRETNDIEWFVSRGYVYVHQDVRGSGQVGGGGVPALQPGRAERLLRHGGVDRGASAGAPARWG